MLESPLPEALPIQLHPGLGTVVVGLNPPTGIDGQHESREARSLYASALQPARALRLEFVVSGT
jgi:hypothetical protein